jgi:hypothetical protein
MKIATTIFCVLSFLPLTRAQFATPYPPQEIIYIAGDTFLDNGKRFVILRWSGAFSQNVNLLRDGQIFDTTMNDGEETFRVMRNQLHTYQIQDPETGVVSLDPITL